MLTPRIEYVYVDQRYFDSNQLEAISSGGSHELFNARLSLGPEEGGWEVALWAKNIGDEQYVVDAADLTATFGFIPTYYGPRESWGIEARIEF